MKTIILKMILGVILTSIVGQLNAQVIESERLATKNEAKPKAANESTDPSPSEFGAIPALTSVLGDRELIPNISVIGAKNYSNGTTYGSIRVFTGVVTEKENDEPGNAAVLFIPEASSFGFTGVFTKKFTKKVPLGLNVGLSYLGKNLRPDTVNNIPTSVFHGKFGFEWVIAKDMVSAYFNADALVVADNVADFEEHYSNNKAVKTFFDYGVRLYLDAVPASDLSLVIDLNFIAQNGTVKAITQNKDLVIPVLRIGLKKSI